MKLTMQLTLDGLIRALRLKAHALAEDIEAGYAGDAQDVDENRARMAPMATRSLTREQNDARASR